MQRATNYREQDMPEGHFFTVLRPSRAEGVGRALQAAFRDGFQLPADMQHSLDRLDRVRC
jgi:hypothetical protein